MKKNIVREKLRELRSAVLHPDHLKYLYSAFYIQLVSTYQKKKYIYIYIHSWSHRWAISRGRAGLQRLLGPFGSWSQLTKKIYIYIHIWSHRWAIIRGEGWTPSVNRFVWYGILNIYF